jgi:ABC-type transporter Mla subunit MlaD
LPRADDLEREFAEILDREAPSGPTAAASDVRLAIMASCESTTKQFLARLDAADRRLAEARRLVVQLADVLGKIGNELADQIDNTMLDLDDLTNKVRASPLAKQLPRYPAPPPPNDNRVPPTMDLNGGKPV